MHDTLPALGVAALWLAACVLMGIDFDNGSQTGLGRISLLLGLAATCGTIRLALKHHRRVILEVMSWEHRLYDRRNGGVGEDERSNVRAIHR